MSEETERDVLGRKGSGGGGDSSSGQEFGRKRSEVRITWDEQTIAEHDKLRGTRQKIDEPSTPYHYGSGESSQGSDCESADGKLSSSVSSTPNAGMSPTGSPHQSSGGRGKYRGGKRGSILKVIEDVSAALPSESALRRERQARWDSDVSENSATEDKEKARKFKARREAHYNEFRALREWKANKGKEGDVMADESDSDCAENGPDMAEERRRRRAGAAAAIASASGASAGSLGGRGAGAVGAGASSIASSCTAAQVLDGMEIETDEDTVESKISAGVEETKSRGFDR